ncbi:ABC transporter ATP-binding protein [Granulicoccus phenolivorans]|uniref:ABC transporter ATP-binding protein n=1 Tax=Granulicoccus phenolivorans TaxID=266854 RepID=UPI0003FF957A|nr:ATP-binding cassette domain-containing protein [Granulicoccus phenolivorans]
MIEFKSVSKTYHDGTQAVRELSLTVPSDGITVFVGPSGCGKTTTLRMINRMIEPTRGEIVWDGVPIRKIKKTTLRRQMGYVIQNGGLFPHRTIVENIGTVPQLLGWDDHATQRAALQLMDQVGLDRKLANRFPAQLSGGQQQRVGVARALAANPDLLLMDEPFSAVDPVVRADLQTLVSDLQRELNKTVVLITHDIDEAIRMGDRIVVLKPGGVLAQYGTPQEILDHPADDFVAEFAGRDRGYRSLTFTRSSDLTLSAVATVRHAAAAWSREGADRTEPVLVLDEQARPAGWADPARPGATLQLGSTFTVGSSMLRDVLEAALTSPVGLAVGVQESGRYAGVVPATEVMTLVQRHRATVAEDNAAAAAQSEPGTTTTPKPEAVEDEAVEPEAVEPAAVEADVVAPEAVEPGDGTK